MLGESFQSLLELGAWHGETQLQGKVTVIAYHRAKLGKEEALRKALLRVCTPTRAEKGCLNYDLHVSWLAPRERSCRSLD